MNTIPLTPVSGSSHVVAHGYDPQTKTLAVQFKNATYHYHDVPELIYDAFRNAPSKGRALQDLLGGGKFKYTKLEQETA